MQDQEIETFLKEHRIDEVECLVPDMAGIARGKILPAQKFLDGMRKNGLRIPEDIFIQTVNGDYPEDSDNVTGASARDVYLIPAIGIAHVCTPVTNAHLVCRHLLAK